MTEKQLEEKYLGKHVRYRSLPYTLYGMVNNVAIDKVTKGYPFAIFHIGNSRKEVDLEYVDEWITLL